jgi:hypothetical protein
MGYRIMVCLTFVAACMVAQEQVSKRPPGWPCVGGRAVDPSYTAVAEGSGGHLYMLDPSEIAQTGTLMAWHQKHTETIYRAMGEMTPGERTFEFPVDSTIESLVITVSLQCKASVSILGSGGTAAAGEPVDFKAGRALRVAYPAPGVWKVRLAGRGLFFVTAEAVTALSLDEARFVSPGGRPGHEGLFPTKTQPPVGSTGLLRLEVDNAPESLQLRFVDSSAQTLDTSAVTVLSEGSFLASVPLRHSAFRIAVAGVDGRGWPFQRMNGPLTVLGPAAEQ